MSIWYLSFAGEHGWLGCIHTEAEGLEEAVHRTDCLGLHPKEPHEIAGVAIEPEAFKTPCGQKALKVLDQFLDRAACNALFGEHEMVKARVRGVDD